MDFYPSSPDPSPVLGPLDDSDPFHTVNDGPFDTVDDGCLLLRDFLDDYNGSTLVKDEASAYEAPAGFLTGLQGVPAGSAAGMHPDFVQADSAGDNTRWLRSSLSSSVPTTPQVEASDNNGSPQLQTPVDSVHHQEAPVPESESQTEAAANGSAAPSGEGENTKLRKKMIKVLTDQPYEVKERQCVLVEKKHSVLFPERYKEGKKNFLRRWVEWVPSENRGIVAVDSCRNAAALGKQCLLVRETESGTDFKAYALLCEDGKINYDPQAVDAALIKMWGDLKNTRVAKEAAKEEHTPEELAPPPKKPRKKSH